MFLSGSALLTGTFLAAAAGSAFAPVGILRSSASRGGLMPGWAARCREVVHSFGMIVAKFREVRQASANLDFPRRRTTSTRAWPKVMRSRAVTYHSYASSDYVTAIVLLREEDALAT